MRAVDLLALEMEIAELDNVYRPLVTKPGPESEVENSARLVARISKVLRDLGVHDRAAVAVRAALTAYVEGDEASRATIRRIFHQYPSFRIVARLPPEWMTIEEFRAQLVHLSARDQAGDARDEILALDAMCARARQMGFDIDPIVREVAAMSSDEDRHGLGSMRALILHYGTTRA